MGRTSNTAQAISKDRAHVHFELNFLLNDQFRGVVSQSIALASETIMAIGTGRIWLRSIHSKSC